MLYKARLFRIPLCSERIPWINKVFNSIFQFQKTIKAIFTMFTSEFKTFDVVLNTWLQKKGRAQNMTVFFLSSQLVFVLNGCSLALSESYI